MKLKTVPILALSAALAFVGCSKSTDSGSSNSSAVGSTGSTVTVENCGEQKTYPFPVTKLFANDGNIISIALAAGAEKDLTAVSSLERDKDIIALKFGDGVNHLNVINKKYPSLENVIGANPQVMFAGWGYGFKDGGEINPSVLTQHHIDSYLLTETCRKADGTRGTIEPWSALTTDIANIGKITGHEDEAKKSIEDIEARRKALESAPKNEKEPVGFLFDSGSDTIFSSGSFGAPQAMMTTAGVKNALSDVADTWTKVSWERLTAADPDVIFFVDYPPQTYEEKIKMLETNDASKNLKAVKEKRYVNLPYAMWTSGPLNIDGAEYIRKALESFGLQPKTEITPSLDITKLDNLPGNEWLKKN